MALRGVFRFVFGRLFGKLGMHAKEPSGRILEGGCEDFTEESGGFALQRSTILVSLHFGYETKGGKGIGSLDFRGGEYQHPDISHSIQAEQFGGEQFPVEGEVLQANDEDIGMKFRKTVGELYRIPVSDDGVFLETGTVGDGARKGIVFR